MVYDHDTCQILIGIDPEQRRQLETLAKAYGGVVVRFARFNTKEEMETFREAHWPLIRYWGRPPEDDEEL